MANNSAANASCTVQTSRLAATCTEKICKQGFIDCEKLKSVEAIERAFDDSSCLVWRLCLSNELTDRSLSYVLKVAEKEQTSPFWKMMSGLFDVSIEANILQGSFIYDFIRRMVPITVPEYVRSSNMEDMVCVMMTHIEGNATLDNKVSDAIVENFAEYMAATHKNAVKGFGCLKSVLHGNGGFYPKDWNKRLLEVFEVLGQENQQASEVVEGVKEQLETIQVQRFVPVMMDLRWDQFAIHEDKLHGVYDLDAYVAAPIELDFVLLEYLLPKKQLDLFTKVYKDKKGRLPKIKEVRDVYRALFFLINALGEKDFDKWMAQPTYFD